MNATSHKEDTPTVFSTIDAVVFDLDGTLTQSEEGIFNCVTYALEKMGLPVPTGDALRAFIGPPLVWSFRHLCGMSDADARRGVELYRERYTTVGLFENRVYPGIRRLLRMLKARGAYVAVATGKPQEPARRIMEYFGLARYFDAIVGPTPEYDSSDKQLLITRALNGHTGRAVMVGDRKFDVEGAKAVGIASVGVGYGYGTKDELRGAGCDAYVPTVQALIDLLCPAQEPPKGAFISMEGLDGSGKTTQLKLMLDGLDRWGYEVALTREPGGCPISEKIRGVVLGRENVGMCAETEALLYAASRAQLVRQVIRPEMAAGKLVVSDRFVDSSVAYQGGGRSLGVSRVLAMNAPAVDGTLPCATVYLKIDHETSLARRCAVSVPDRIEMEEASFFGRVEAGYEELIANDPHRFLVVDATGTPEAIGKEVLTRVLARLAEEEA